MNRKKGDNKKNGVTDSSSFDTIRIRRVTMQKLKEYKETTGIPMSSFIDKAVNDRLKKLKFIL
jgi:hypothetical protein